MNTLAARLALAGPALVLDGGNAFNALAITRQVRRQTANLELVLERLLVARAFTCYQMTAMLAQQPASSHPLLVLDLLATFGDESATLAERSRLLDQALADLRRLSAAAPVTVSAVPGPGSTDLRLPLGHPARLAAPLPVMFERLEEAVDQVLRFEAHITHVQKSFDFLETIPKARKDRS
jgi:hypothetical protein